MSEVFRTIVFAANIWISVDITKTLIFHSQMPVGLIVLASFALLFNVLAAIGYLVHVNERR